MSEFPAYALRTGMHAGEAVAGKIVARKVRGLTKQQPGSLVGSLIEAGVGLVGGFALSMLHPSLGEFFAVGGLMAPIETAVQRLGIPHVSDSLGDDGYYVGPGTGVTLVSSNPDDYQGVAGYVPGDGSVAGYVPGEGFDEFSASRSANNAA